MAEISATDKKAAIKAWHDAVTDDARAAAVKQYPFLVEMYALAMNHAPKSDQKAESNPA